jgi:DNA-binding MarR family transcriptional regulator
MTRTLKLSQADTYHLITGRTTLLLNRLLTQRFKEAQIPISREQWSILAVLWIQDGCPQQFIANETDRDKPSTARLIDTLEKDGFIYRQGDPKDRRINLIFLTEKGKALEKSINPIVEQTLSDATRGISNKEKQIVKSSFEKVYNNIINCLK